MEVSPHWPGVGKYLGMVIEQSSTLELCMNHSGNPIFIEPTELNNYEISQWNKRQKELNNTVDYQKNF